MRVYMGLADVLKTLSFAAVAVALALSCALTLGSCSAAGRGGYYARLTSATSERERIDIVNQATAGTPSRECLADFARYWIDNLEYLEAHPTLYILLSSSLHEKRYHDPVFATWIMDTLVPSESTDRRRCAWVFMSQTNWHIDETVLLEAVERERKIQASGVYTNIEPTHDAIGRIGRRLYPESTWWQPLIQTRYGK